MDAETRNACRSATGYLELGMAEEALAELAGITHGPPELLHLRVEILFSLKRWREAAEICLPMLKRDPDEPAWWIQAAYAVRRWQSLEAAEPILKNALHHHPDNLLIGYNLACYACMGGRHDEARQLLARAIDDKPGEILQLAKNDPDLEAILPWIHARALEGRSK